MPPLPGQPYPPFSQVLASSNQIVRVIGDYDASAHPHCRIRDGVMNPFVEGVVVNKGTFEEVLNSGLDFAKLLPSANEDEPKEDPPLIRKIQSRQISTITVNSIQDDADILEPEESEEFQTKGAVKWMTYWRYTRAGGNICFLSFVFFMLCFSQVTTNAVDFWLTYCHDDYSELCFKMRLALIGQSHDTLSELYLSYLSTHVLFSITTAMEEEKQLWQYEVGENESSLNASSIIPTSTFSIFTTELSLTIYGVLMIICVIFVLARSALFFLFCMKSSIQLHNTMFENILRSKMRFFDTNPSGRILNRFSKDMGSVDELLPRALIDTIQQRYALFLMAPCFISARSPVFSHLSASMNGLPTIRSSHAQQMVRKEFDHHQGGAPGILRPQYAVPLGVPPHSGSNSHQFGESPSGDRHPPPHHLGRCPNKDFAPLTIYNITTYGQPKDLQNYLILT
uniref:ABC transmembrane type-1 domain-containing protein n=1 Tax=Timema cristinae TaxID=61476 RepID=A0A7R9CC74_TIMCR|nr:unnamed protein product [Timema cristinae]